MVLVKAKGRFRAYDPGGVSTAPLITAIPPPAFLREVTIYSPNQCTKREDEQDDEGFPNRMNSPSVHAGRDNGRAELTLNGAMTMGLRQDSENAVSSDVSATTRLRRPSATRVTPAVKTQ